MHNDEILDPDDHISHGTKGVQIAWLFSAHCRATIVFLFQPPHHFILFS